MKIHLDVDIFIAVNFKADKNGTSLIHIKIVRTFTCRVPVVDLLEALHLWSLEEKEEPYLAVHGIFLIGKQQPSLNGKQLGAFVSKKIKTQREKNQQ